MNSEIDAIYHGHPFDYVDTQHDMIARTLFRGAMEEAQQFAEADPLLVTGSLQGEAYVNALLAATTENVGNGCWSPDAVRQYLANACWPDVNSLEAEGKRAVITAQFFLQACAAGSYGIQFGC